MSRLLTQGEVDALHRDAVGTSRDAHGKVMRRAAMEEAAAICDKLGDEEFARRMKKGNAGIATLAQRHYIACADAIRALV